MIKAGETIPAVAVKLVTADGVSDADSAELLGKGRIVLFTVPGAFTPTCSNNHLPGFVASTARIRALGVDRIICATVNDHHVTKAWAENQHALGAVDFIADFAADFAKALGLTKDMTAGGLGVRFVRSALVIENGIVQDVFIDDVPGQVTSSGAAAVLDSLKSQTTHSAA